MKKINGIIISLILMIFLSGCTKDENSVGYDSMGEPLYLQISGEKSIGNVYSFEDSISNYYNSPILTIGNREEYESMALLKFNGLPDTLSEIENNKIKLIMFVNKQHGSENTNLLIWEIGEYWEEDEVTYTAATDTSEWENSDLFFVPDTAATYNSSQTYSEGDSIIVDIPVERVYSEVDGKMEVDSLIAEHGIFVKRNGMNAGESDFIEFYSYESDSSRQPRLTFRYKSDEDDTEYTSWTSTSVEDAAIYRSIDDDLGDYDIYDGEIRLRNISPVKMFLEIILTDAVLDSIIINSDNGVNNYDQEFPVTINKAYLNLTAKEDYYGSTSYIYTQPAVLTNSEMIENQVEIPEYGDDYTLVSGVTISQDSLLSLEGDLIYKIDITSELQSIIIENDDIDGHGLIIRSTRENRDFSYIDFYSKDDDVTKAPYLEVYCTPPLGD